MRSNKMSENRQNETRKGTGENGSTKKRKGYKPMQEGYQPSDDLGYTATGDGTGSARPNASTLPKPPKGGTGESSGTASTNSSE